MDVKEAVKTAKDYVTELFEGEGLENVGLEEVLFDDEAGVWRVTVGFNRPWDNAKNLADAMSAISAGELPEWRRRSFKVVRIQDGTGKVISLTHRVPAE